MSVDHHCRHVFGLCPVNQGFDNRYGWVRERGGDARVVEQNKIGLFADFQSSNLIAEADRIRAVLGRHPEYLRRADWFLVDAGTRMQMPDKSHFLQHVAVVVEAGLVDADGDWNAARHDFAYRRYSASQAEIRARIVANADAVFCDDVQIALA